MSTAAKQQLKAHLTAAPWEDQVRMTGVRSSRAAEVLVSTTLSSLFPRNPQQKTLSEETILFQWLYQPVETRFPCGTASLQISALTRSFTLSAGHTQRRLHLSVTVCPQTRLVERPGSEKDGSRLSSRSLGLEVTLHFCLGKYVKFCHKSGKNLMDNCTHLTR